MRTQTNLAEHPEAMEGLGEFTEVMPDREEEEQAIAPGKPTIECQHEEEQFRCDHQREFSFEYRWVELDWQYQSRDAEHETEVEDIGAHDVANGRIGVVPH